MLDLCYEEDVRAETDMNVVCSGDGRFIEVQGTGAAGDFTLQELNAMIALAQGGIRRLFELQQQALNG